AFRFPVIRRGNVVLQRIEGATPFHFDSFDQTGRAGLDFGALQFQNVPLLYQFGFAAAERSQRPRASHELRVAAGNLAFPVSEALGEVVTVGGEDANLPAGVLPDAGEPFLSARQLRELAFDLARSPGGAVLRVL